MNRTRRTPSPAPAASRWLLLALLPVLGAGACGPCTPGPTDAGTDAAGTVQARVLDDGSVEVRLDNLRASLRTLQVDVSLTGTAATAVEPAGPVSHDLLEAGLSSPRASFTLVVADTRRVPLTDGAVARLVTGAAPGQVTLAAAQAVDADGQHVLLDTEVLP